MVSSIDSNIDNRYDTARFPQERLGSGGMALAQLAASRVGAKIGKRRSGQPCFPAGTMLKTHDGWKAIEEFRAGDEIVSRPEHRPEAANTVRKVTRLLTRSGQVLDLWVQGRRIETTNEHPYWVVGKGWKTANTLQVGDIFLTSDNRQVVLERIEDHNRYVPVYNLEVEDDHTYFVGDANWGFDV